MKKKPWPPMSDAARDALLHKGHIRCQQFFDELASSYGSFWASAIFRQFAKGLPKRRIKKTVGAKSQRSRDLDRAILAAGMAAPKGKQRAAVAKVPGVKNANAGWVRFKRLQKEENIWAEFEAGFKAIGYQMIR
jgi:hypothetical protein